MIAAVVPRPGDGRGRGLRAHARPRGATLLRRATDGPMMRSQTVAKGPRPIAADFGVIHEMIRAVVHRADIWTRESLWTATILG